MSKPAAKRPGKILKKDIKFVKKKLGFKKLSMNAITPGGNRVRGRGNYWDDFKGWAKKGISVLNEDGPREGASSFNKGINAFGNAIGSEFGIGKQLGNAGSWLSRVIGMGKYHINKNSLLHPTGENLVSGMDTASPPSFSTTSRGSDIIFSHREFIADVRSSVNFQTTTYPINPGNPSLFPWMHQIASLYEEYEMLGMILEYKSSSGTANTAAVPGMGLVLMATDYDPYDTTFNSKRQMEAAEFSSSGVPYANFLHPIECDPKRNVLRTQYVVPGITNYTEASGDARFSVLGNTTIATIGQQADNITMGELWCTYHVRLSRPILETNNVPFNQHVKVDCNTNGFVGIPVVNTSNGGIPFELETAGLATTLRLLIGNVANQLSGRFRVTYTGVRASTATVSLPSLPNAAPLSKIVQNIGATQYNDVRGDSFGFGFGLNTNALVSTGLYTINTTGSAVLDIPLINFNIVQTIDIFIERVDINLAETNTLSRNEARALQSRNFSKNEVISSPSPLVLLDDPNKTKLKIINEEPDVVTDSAIAVLQSECVGNYTLDECRERIDSIKDFISSDLKAGQLNMLLAKLKLCVDREKELVNKVKVTDW